MFKSIITMLLLPVVAAAQSFGPSSTVYTNFHGDGPFAVGGITNLGSIWAEFPYGTVNETNYNPRHTYQVVSDAIMAVDDRLSVDTYYPFAEWSNEAQAWYVTFTSIRDAWGNGENRSNNVSRRSASLVLTVCKGVLYHTIIPNYVDHTRESEFIDHLNLYGPPVPHFSNTNAMMDPTFSTLGVSFWEEVDTWTNSLSSPFTQDLDYTNRPRRDLTSTNVPGFWYLPMVLTNLKWTCVQGNPDEPCAYTQDVSSVAAFTYTNETYSATTTATLVSLTPPATLVAWWEDCPWAENSIAWADVWAAITQDCSPIYPDSYPGFSINADRDAASESMTYTWDTCDTSKVLDWTNAYEWVIYGSITRPDASVEATCTNAQVIFNSQPRWPVTNHYCVADRYVQIVGDFTVATNGWFQYQLPWWNPDTLSWDFIDFENLQPTCTNGGFGGYCSGYYFFMASDFYIDMTNMFDVLGTLGWLDMGGVCQTGSNYLECLADCCRDHSSIYDHVYWTECYTGAAVYLVQCATNYYEFCIWTNVYTNCQVVYSNTYDNSLFVDCNQDPFPPWTGIVATAASETNAFFTNCVAFGCDIDCLTNCYVYVISNGWDVVNNHPAPYNVSTWEINGCMGVNGIEYTGSDGANASDSWSISNSCFVLKWDQYRQESCGSAVGGNPCNTNVDVVGWGFPDLVGDCWNLLQ